MRAHVSPTMLVQIDFDALSLDSAGARFQRAMESTLAKPGGMDTFKKAAARAMRAKPRVFFQFTMTNFTERTHDAASEECSRSLAFDSSAPQSV